MRSPLGLCHLVDSAMLAYESVLRLTHYRGARRYYAESKTMAALFGIPARPCLPTGTPSNSTTGNACLRRSRRERALPRTGPWSPVRRRFLVSVTPLVSCAHRPLDARPVTRRLWIRLRRIRPGSGSSALRWLQRIYRNLPSPLRFRRPVSRGAIPAAGAESPASSSGQ